MSLVAAVLLLVALLFTIVALAGGALLGLQAVELLAVAVLLVLVVVLAGVTGVVSGVVHKG